MSKHAPPQFLSCGELGLAHPVPPHVFCIFHVERILQAATVSAKIMKSEIQHILAGVFALHLSCQAPSPPLYPVRNMQRCLWKFWCSLPPPPPFFPPPPPLTLLQSFDNVNGSVSQMGRPSLGCIAVWVSGNLARTFIQPHNWGTDLNASGGEKIIY
jgi:hypothetical protein